MVNPSDIVIPNDIVIPSEARDLDRGEIFPPRPRSLASLGMTGLLG